MTRLARVVCTIYGATALFLAYATVQQALYGDELWAVAALSACSVVPLIGLVRETEHADAMAKARVFGESAPADRTDRPPLPRRIPGAEIAVADAMAAACCETWWATAGAEHDPATCSKEGSTA